MLPKRTFTTESPLYGIKHGGMAAMLTEWLGVVYLTPSAAGGAAVAAIWERIHAHEAAKEPMSRCQRTWPSGRSALAPRQWQQSGSVYTHTWPPTSRPRTVDGEARNDSGEVDADGLVWRYHTAKATWIRDRKEESRGQRKRERRVISQGTRAPEEPERRLQR